MELGAFEQIEQETKIFCQAKSVALLADSLVQMMLLPKSNDLLRSFLSVVAPANESSTDLLA